MDEKRINGGYEIIESCTIGNNELVIGHLAQLHGALMYILLLAGHPAVPFLHWAPSLSSRLQRPSSYAMHFFSEHQPKRSVVISVRLIHE